MWYIEGRQRVLGKERSENQKKFVAAAPQTDQKRTGNHRGRMSLPQSRGRGGPGPTRNERMGQKKGSGGERGKRETKIHPFFLRT